MHASLGIDLAAQPANTAACLIEWGDAGARVVFVRHGAECSDDALVGWMADATEVGIDAPFGWPVAFVDAVSDYSVSGDWPAAPRVEGARIHYRDLRYRETDLAVNRLLQSERGVSLWPLSVSSDSIAVVAWRCAHLLHRHADSTGRAVDRTGEGTGVFETYPAAALAAWDLPRRGYKVRAAGGRAVAEQTRRDILSGIERAGRGWLDLGATPSVREQLIASDHALDAFISALVTRAAAAGQTTPPRPDQLERARSEGWIHVPRPEGLAGLA